MQQDRPAQQEEKRAQPEEKKAQQERPAQQEEKHAQQEQKPQQEKPAAQHEQQASARKATAAAFLTTASSQLWTRTRFGLTNPATTIISLSIRRLLVRIRPPLAEHWPTRKTFLWIRDGGYYLCNPVHPGFDRHRRHLTRVLLERGRSTVVLNAGKRRTGGPASEIFVFLPRLGTVSAPVAGPPLRFL